MDFLVHLVEPATVQGLFGVGLVARFVIVVAYFGGHCVTCLSVSLFD